ncbi:MAG: hypothetical protein KJN82_04930 [Bacteroidia bacterium]|nr:hypothetical protein [Bacteroidia bacterium]
MKKITFLLVIFLISSSLSFGQDETISNNKYRSEFRIAVGINAIQNLGTRQPFTDIDEWSFGLPLSAGFEYNFARNWSVEQAITINKFSSGSNIDTAITSEDYTFLGTNTNIKFYPHWSKSDNFKLFANAGLGVFKIEELNTSANLGGGILYWFSDKIGLRGTALAKWAIDNKERVYDTNHFQYMLEVIFKL